MNHFADPADARDFRRAAARDRCDRLRKEAINALGGKCPKCGIENDPRDLKLLTLTDEARKWSQVVFYRRVIEDPDRDRFARLICNKCRFNEVQEGRLRAPSKEPRPEGTGEFYWVGGQRVEQKRKKASVSDKGELVTHPRYQD